jgi:hypothetical protein
MNFRDVILLLNAFNLALIAIALIVIAGRI